MDVCTGCWVRLLSVPHQGCSWHAVVHSCSHRPHSTTPCCCVLSVRFLRAYANGSSVQHHVDELASWWCSSYGCPCCWLAVAVMILLLLGSLLSSSCLQHALTFLQKVVGHSSHLCSHMWAVRCRLSACRLVSADHRMAWLLQGTTSVWVIAGRPYRMCQLSSDLFTHQHWRFCTVGLALGPPSFTGNNGVIGMVHVEHRCSDSYSM